MNYDKAYEMLDNIKHQLNRAAYCSDTRNAIKDSIASLLDFVLFLEKQERKDDHTR